MDRRGNRWLARLCTVILVAAGTVALSGPAGAAPVSARALSAGCTSAQASVTGTVTCVRITSASTVTAMPATSAAAEAGCGNGSWAVTSRRAACTIFTGEMSIVTVPDNILIGQIWFTVSSVVGTRGSEGDYWHQTFDYEPDLWWGAVGLSEVIPFPECRAACSFMGSTAAIRGSALEHRSGTQLFSTSGPQFGRWIAGSDFGFYFYNPNTVNQVTNTLFTQYPGHRCDNALPGFYARAGCVQQDWLSILPVSQASTPTYFNHIASSQDVGTPKFLNRLTDETRENINREIACPPTDAQHPRPNGYSCDEYPFASTYQGAGERPGGFTMEAHTKRLDISCKVPWLPKHTETSNRGYSVCMITVLDNGTGGGQLSKFYYDNRILDMDLFEVRPGP